jgi:glycosyltransferase involved in cell wall biosynthesis
MIGRGLARKFRVGMKVLHEAGFANFVALSLEFSAKNIRKFSRKKSEDSTTSLDRVYTRVRYEDALRADFHKGRHPWKGSKESSLVFNWLMPPPGKGSGGHINIFRFIKFLEDAGHSCNIYLYTQEGESRINDILALMGDSYSNVKAKMQWLPASNEMVAADGIFATSWETAYASLNAAQEAKRYYFVQDFEPYFYPAGGLYALAENTYKFGFFGITAGGWLAKKLHEDYGMQTDHFDFGSDPTTYSFENKNTRKEVLFYARPYTERRGFEVGLMALDLFHKKHPDYCINLVGYDVSNYDIPFPYKNLQILEINELNDLYNRCAAGLVLSFTNMSLLPLELLSSGTIPVVNGGENNRLVSNNPYIAYSENDPVSLADTLSAVVTKTDLPIYARNASESAGTASWKESGKKFIDIVERETKANG